mmetsp:Transcript_127479/g.271822  ORF Transcript_127479/g.271822 Transcript_127479/m.271822 type:complete len:220 (-) Transcript_127479:18-677(-)
MTSFGALMQPICKVLTGKSITNGPADEEQNAPLITGDSFVHFLGTNAILAERVPERAPQELEALTTLPIEFNVPLPQGYEPGQKIILKGPHGNIEIEAPAGAEPGAVLRHRIAPTPEFRVQVPPGAGGGSQARFKMQDGQEISVVVPEGASPGDSFDVLPPALMVLVPQGAGPGSAVVFRHTVGQRGATEIAEWMRVRVPEGIKEGKYFAARLPPPPGR